MSEMLLSQTFLFSRGFIPLWFYFFYLLGIIEDMKVLLYLEGKAVLEKSGIGRALQHQMKALDLAGIPYTTDPSGDYDVVHILWT